MLAPGEIKLRPDWLPNVRPGPVMSQGAMEAGMTDESLAAGGGGGGVSQFLWAAAIVSSPLPLLLPPKLGTGNMKKYTSGADNV